MRPLTLNTTCCFECPAVADVRAAFPDHELHLADGALGRLMDEVYHPETVEAILDFTYRTTKAISEAISLIGCVSPVTIIIERQVRGSACPANYSSTESTMLQQSLELARPIQYVQKPCWAKETLKADNPHPHSSPLPRMHTLLDLP
jgi:hypothetical protein